jgi:hypothetical protein
MLVTFARMRWSELEIAEYDKLYYIIGLQSYYLSEEKQKATLYATAMHAKELTATSNSVKSETDTKTYPHTEPPYLVP